MKLDKKDLRNIEDDIYKTNEIERIVKNNLYDAIVSVGEGHITLDEITRRITADIHDCIKEKTRKARIDEYNDSFYDK